MQFVSKFEYIYCDGVKVRMSPGFPKKGFVHLEWGEKHPQLEWGGPSNLQIKS